MRDKYDYMICLLHKDSPNKRSSEDEKTTHR